MVCHIILWLVGVVPIYTNRKGGSTGFFAYEHFLLADTCEKSPFWPFLPAPNAQQTPKQIWRCTPLNDAAATLKNISCFYREIIILWLIHSIIILIWAFSCYVIVYGHSSHRQLQQWEYSAFAFSHAVWSKCHCDNSSWPAGSSRGSIELLSCVLIIRVYLCLMKMCRSAWRLFVFLNSLIYPYHDDIRVQFKK